MTSVTYFAKYPSPIGEFLLLSDGSALTGLYMENEILPTGIPNEDLPIFAQTGTWLDSYFRGENPSIGFQLAPKGTPFQQQVWQILLAIPYGQTRSYGDIAREMAMIMGREKMSAQAVGQAVGHNPISILIPCHRVVGAKGQLTGYAGGLDKKIWLLQHEGWLEK